jgi:hypothetical protein
VDVDPKSFEVPEVARALSEAKTIFVNAVMGLTPFFFEGTKKMDEIIDNNKAAQKYYGASRCGSYIQAPDDGCLVQLRVERADGVVSFLSLIAPLVSGFLCE